MIKCFYLLCVFLGVYTQELTTTIFQHYPPFTSLMEQDARAIEEAEYTVAVLVKPDEEESVTNADNIEPLLKSEAVKLSKILSIPVKYVRIEYRSKGKLYIDCDNNKVDLIYVCAEFNDEDISRIRFVAESLEILTFTGSEDLYDEGLSATVRLEDDQPQLIIRTESLVKERKALAPNTFSDIAQFER